MPDPTRGDEGPDYLPPWLAQLRAHPSSRDPVNGAPERQPANDGRHPALRLLAAIAVPVAAAIVIIVAGALHLAGVVGPPVTSPSPGITASPTSSATPAPTTSPWQTISVPSGVSAGSLTCLDADDCWLLGANNSDGSVQRGGRATASSVWEYSDGAWTSLSISGPVTIQGLTCVTESDCWAVGYLVPAAGMDTDGILQPTIEQDTGAGFNLVSSPLMTGLDMLNGVACPSTDDCWAVGRYGSQTVTQNPGSIQATETLVAHPLVEHYDGTGWVVAPVPAPTDNATLTAVTCVSTQECWAVGQEYDVGTLIEHYSDGAWTLVPSPGAAEMAGDQLVAVVCPTITECWAVGYTGAGDTQQPMVEHYSSGAWTVVPSPDITSANGGELSGIACTPAGDCWAVGTASGPAWTLVGTPPPDMAQAIIERWSGSAWEMLTSPQEFGGETALLGISCPPSTSSVCYAVGGSLFLTHTGA